MSVKHVEGHDVIEGRSHTEAMSTGSRGIFEGKPVATETVVVNVRQIVPCLIHVGNKHAALDQKTKLIVDGKRGFGVLHSKTAQKKVTRLGAHARPRSAEAWRVLLVLIMYPNCGDFKLSECMNQIWCHGILKAQTHPGAKSKLKLK